MPSITSRSNPVVARFRTLADAPDREGLRLLLDGGHLVFYIWEAVFRRPLRPRIQEIGMKVGFVLVIALAILLPILSLNQGVH